MTKTPTTYPAGLHGRYTKGPPVEIRKKGDEIDELVFRGVDVHIERMTADGWFIGVDAADGYHQFWLGAKNRKSEVVVRHTESSSR